MSDRLITIAIHTYDRAIALKMLLEKEGVSATIQNVNLSHPVVSPGVRVRIKEDDLPLALRIVENQDIFSDKNDGVDHPLEILIPVDFSECSEKATLVGFHLAALHGASVILLHSFVDPTTTNRVQLSDVLNFDAQSVDQDARQAVVQEAERQMQILKDKIIGKIKDGEIPGAKFSTKIVEGLPEESINQYSKENSPLLIVMGTRGADKKEREMVGSVTAEVLDTCRYPVFTIPESINCNCTKELSSILFFSNFDQEDILALDALFHLLKDKELNVMLVKMPEKKQSSHSSDKLLSKLSEYCKQHYPKHRFCIESISVDNIEKEFNRISEKMQGKLIVVPNKKKNIFARLFNPGIAHRMLFHSDIPMIVIPV